MTKDEIKALVAAKIAGQGTNVDGGGALSDVLNAILDAIPEIPESGVMPEPKYVVPGDIDSDIDDGQFAESLGISVDEIPDFFGAQVIKRNSVHLTRTFFEHNEGSDEQYRAIFGAVTANYGCQMTFLYSVPNHNVIIEINEV